MTMHTAAARANVNTSWACQDAVSSPAKKKTNSRMTEQQVLAARPGSTTCLPSTLTNNLPVNHFNLSTWGATCHLLLVSTSECVCPIELILRHLTVGTSTTCQLQTWLLIAINVKKSLSVHTLCKWLLPNNTHKTANMNYSFSVTVKCVTALHYCYLLSLFHDGHSSSWVVCP